MRWLTWAAVIVFAGYIPNFWLAFLPGEGAVTIFLPIFGTAAVLVYQTTTYKLTASNDFGTRTATATVNQSTPIGISSAGFLVRRVNSNTAFPFSGMGYLASAVSLANQTSGGPQYSSESSGTYTQINFSDGADGDFTGGNVGFQHPVRPTTSTGPQFIAGNCKVR